MDNLNALFRRKIGRELLGRIQSERDRSRLPIAMQHTEEEEELRWKQEGLAL